MRPRADTADKDKRRSRALMATSREKYLTQRLAASCGSLHRLDPDSDEGGEVSGSAPDSGLAQPDVTDSVELQATEQAEEDVEEGRTVGVVDTVDGDVHVPLLREGPRPAGLGRSKTERAVRRRTFRPMGRYDRSSSFYDDRDRRAATIRPQDFSFPFENLVFEGGGNKGLAYCGAVKYLEELGVMSHVTGMAGTSAGGMFAALLAVGYTSLEIEQFLSDRIDRIFLDATCGYCSLLPNLLRSFGWNPGRRLFDWFGEKLEEKTNNADITFHEVYQRYGKLLCIVVTNLNQMTTEYCHPKTTPYMPIRTAIRMSMAIPGLFTAHRYERFGNQDVFVDGGVLCNYPIHCFDGWFLSMDPQDSFIRRLQPLREIPILMERQNRFGTFNEKTLGMLLYSDAEEDILRMSLERRIGCLLPAKPQTETRLYVQRQREAKLKQRAEREHAKVVQAVDSFLRVLKKHNIDKNDVIDRTELANAFQDEGEFPRAQAEVLFGKDFTVQEACQLLDGDSNGQIRYDELVRFIEDNGVNLQSRFLGYQRREIKDFRSFLGSLQSTLIYNVKKLYVENRDLERTVGINTGHVQTTDFVLEEPDREFVVQRGYNSMKSFLQYYVVLNPDKAPPKGDCSAIHNSSCADIPEVPSDPDLANGGGDHDGRRLDDGTQVSRP